MKATTALKPGFSVTEILKGRREMNYNLLNCRLFYAGTAYNRDSTHGKMEFLVLTVPYSLVGTGHMCFK